MVVLNPYMFIYMSFSMDLTVGELLANQLLWGMASGPRPFPKASVASRREGARPRGDGAVPDLAPASGLSQPIFPACGFAAFVLFLLRQEPETATSAQGVAVVPASSINPRTILHQSVAQRERQGLSGPNSNRCLSGGSGHQLVSVRMS